jgi:hypothetical protein
MNNLVLEELEMINHNSRSHNLKNTSQRWKIPNVVEFGKNQMVNKFFDLFDYLIGLIFSISL